MTQLNRIKSNKFKDTSLCSKEIQFIWHFPSYVLHVPTLVVTEIVHNYKQLTLNQT